MVNNIFSNLSRGFFYFIGKVLAIIFIGFVIYTIVSKIHPDTEFDDIITAHNLPIYRGVLNEK